MPLPLESHPRHITPHCPTGVHGATWSTAQAKFCYTPGVTLLMTTPECKSWAWHYFSIRNNKQKFYQLNSCIQERNLLSFPWEMHRLWTYLLWSTDSGSSEGKRRRTILSHLRDKLLFASTDFSQGCHPCKASKEKPGCSDTCMQSASPGRVPEHCFCWDQSPP